MQVMCTSGDVIVTWMQYKQCVEHRISTQRRDGRGLYKK
jgi:hypothetical protein